MVEDSELTDLFLYAFAKSNSIDDLINEDDFEVELKMTDGDSSFYGKLHKSDLGKSKHQKNTQSDNEWIILLLQSLFNQLPLKSIDTVEIVAKELSKDGETILEIEVKTKVGPSIYQTLGLLEFKALAESDNINYADELFEWSKIMSSTNKQLQKELVKTKARTKSLEVELKEMQKLQDDLVEESKVKDEIQLKVMTKLLNSKKEHYEKLLKGEITDDPDDFNLIAIKNIKDDFIHEQEKEEKPKPKKPRKAGAKRQPRGVKAAALLRGEKNITKEYPRIKDEDEDEFIPDSQDEAEVKKENDPVEKQMTDEPKKKKVKIEPKDSKIKKEQDEIPQAVKAEPEKSIHFKFNDEDATEDDEEVVEEESKTKDDEGDETVEDTDEDGTEEDLEMKDQDQDQETATDTDSDSE